MNRHRAKKILLFLICIISLAASCSDSSQDHGADTGNVGDAGNVGDPSGEKPNKVDIPDEKIRAKREVTTSKGTFTYIKYVDENGETQSIILNSDGEKVDAHSVGDGEAISPYGGPLLHRIDHASDGTVLVELIIVLDDYVKEPVYPKVSGGSGSDGKGLMIDGQPATEKDLEELEKKKKEIYDKYMEARKEKRKEQIEKLRKRNPDLGITDVDVTKYLNSGDIHLMMAIGNIKDFYEKNKDIIFYIDLKPEIAHD